MTTLSSIAKLPRPELTDPPNAPTAFVNLTNVLDTLVIPKYSSASARDTAIPAPTQGQHAFLNDSDSLTVYSDSAGRWITYAAGQEQAKALSFWETKSLNVGSYTPSATMADLPGCSSTFLTVRPGAIVKVEITADINTGASNAGTAIVLAQLDGVDQLPQVNFNGSNTTTGLRSTNANTFWTTAVVPGTHTVKLRGSGGSNFRLNGPHTNLTISVFE